MPAEPIFTVRVRMPGKRHDRAEGQGVEHHLLPDLIADDHEIVADGGFCDGGLLSLIHHRSRRVERCVDQDGAGFRADGGGERIGVDPPMRRLEPHIARDRPGAAGEGGVGIIKRLEEDDFIPGSSNAKSAPASASVAPEVIITSLIGSR